jgi:hypothetical protein
MVARQEVLLPALPAPGRDARRRFLARAGSALVYGLGVGRLSRGTIRPNWRFRRFGAAHRLSRHLARLRPVQGTVVLDGGSLSASLGKLRLTVRGSPERHSRPRLSGTPFGAGLAKKAAAGLGVTRRADSG